jgi:DNA-binding CsgD family transcriptional regulator
LITETKHDSVQAKGFLRLEAALTTSEAWAAIYPLIRAEMPCKVIAFEFGLAGPARKVLIEGEAALAAELTNGCPLEEVRPDPPAELAANTVRCRFLRVLAWQDHELIGSLAVGRSWDGSDFSAREVRWFQGIRAHFQTTMRRIIAHQAGVIQGERLSSLLEYVPIGLLMLDWDLKPLWRNNEAANCCAVWNHGERRASAINPRRSFRVPTALIRACAEMRVKWDHQLRAGREPNRTPHRIVNEFPAFHAQIAIHRSKGNPFSRPVFQIHVDYRRPRGDREKRISESAVALLDRLSGRERELAMWLREGLRNAEIAAEMRVSPATIKTQLASIYAKLGVSGRTRAAALLNR